MNGTTQAVAVERKFDRKVCGRCAGSGKFSWCQTHGSVCFDCHGTGTVYTKRGAAAAAFYRASLEKVATDIVVGDVILLRGFSCGSFAQASQWVKVVSVSRDSSSAWSTAPDGTRTYHEQVLLACEQVKDPSKKSSLGLNLTSRERVAQSKEQVRVKREAALDYQDTLTKQGTPRASRGVS